MRFRSAITAAAIFAVLFSQAPVVNAQVIALPPDPPAAKVSPAQVLVPAGTRVPVSPTDKVSSATAQVGDIIAVSATENVNANGYLVIQKGAGGQAEVASVERAHGNGGSGKLGIKMDWIVAVDGEKIQLSATQKTASEEDRGGGSSTATILSYALLGPLGLFFHNFARGKDVTLDPSKVLTAYTDGTVHIASNIPAQDSGFAH
jgi:hypothetical protein